jgi:hypothetical protein
MVGAPRGYTRLSVAYKWPFPQDVACIAKAFNISERAVYKVSFGSSQAVFPLTRIPA